RIAVVAFAVGRATRHKGDDEVRKALHLTTDHIVHDIDGEGRDIGERACLIVQHPEIALVHRALIDDAVVICVRVPGANGDGGAHRRVRGDVEDGGWYSGADTLKLGGVGPGAVGDAVTGVDPAISDVGLLATAG